MGTITLSPLAACRFALLVMGFTATAAQIVIIRELLVTFHGNELFIGIILANWMLLEAMGSYFTRKRAERARRHVTWFSLLQILVGLGTLAGILFIRSFKYILQISTGEILGVLYVFCVSLLALAPLSLFDGALFPLGCRGFSVIAKKKEAPARVYFYQAVGSFGAALCFVFYLIYYLNPVELAAVILLLNLCSVILYLTASGEAKALRNTAILIMLPALFISFFSPFPKWLDERSAGIQWYDHSLLTTRNSVYANLAIIKEEEQYTFFANGSPYATSPQPPTIIEEQVHFPMLFHPSPDNILVVGGGAGGFIREILKHPVKKIDYAEQDPLIIECFSEYSTPLTEFELNHEKVTIHSSEGRLFLKKAPRPFDMILVNLPVPSTLLLNRYYTADFFELAGKRLKDNGIFSISLPGSEVFLGRELKELNRTIHASLSEAFPHVRLVVGAENIFIASKKTEVENIGTGVITERLRARGITGGVINELYLRYKTDETRFGPIRKDILASEIRSVNYDIHPAGVFESMLYLNIIASPLVAGTLALIAGIPFAFYPGAMILTVILMLAWQHRQTSRLYLTVAISTTGFTGMFMTILMILAFQIYYGNIYHYIGLITSMFMLGLACGSRFAMNRPDINLLTVESGIVFHAILVYLFFFLRPEAAPSSLTVIFVLTFLSGTLTGVEYPISIYLFDREYSAVSDTGGRLYAVDLAGGFFSALITPVFLIPAIGIKNSLFIIIALKTCSMLLVYAGNSSKTEGQGLKS
jgi:spermidine synthase